MGWGAAWSPSVWSGPHPGPLPHAAETIARMMVLGASGRGRKDARAGHGGCFGVGMAKVSKSVTAEEIRGIAREKLGYADLRVGQMETIRLILSGHDTLSVMPTGSGKSAIYQIAATVIRGPTLIVSPLIALQKDQLEA